MDQKYNITPSKQTFNANGLDGIKSVYDYKQYEQCLYYIKKVEAAVQDNNRVLLFRAKITNRFPVNEIEIFEQIINSIMKK